MAIGTKIKHCAQTYVQGYVHKNEKVLFIHCQFLSFSFQIGSNQIRPDNHEFAQNCDALYFLVSMPDNPRIPKKSNGREWLSNQSQIVFPQRSPCFYIFLVVEFFLVSTLNKQATPPSSLDIHCHFLYFFQCIIISSFFSCCSCWASVLTTCMAIFPVKPIVSKTCTK